MLVAPDKAPAPMKEGDPVSYRRQMYHVQWIWSHEGKPTNVTINRKSCDPHDPMRSFPPARFAWSTERKCWVVTKGSK